MHLLRQQLRERRRLRLRQPLDGRGPTKARGPIRRSPSRDRSTCAPARARILVKNLAVKYRSEVGGAP
jgi:hypothetical protein